MININDALIVSNEKIATDIYGMEIRVPEIATLSRPGQFINLYTNDGATLLPRPISICHSDKERGVLALVYRIAGKGTEIFSQLKSGEKIRTLGPLGNGFPLEKGNIFLVGGGVGIPPLLDLACVLMEQDPDRQLSVYLGYRNNETFLLDMFKKVCANIHIATDNGSVGFHGNVVELLKDSPFPAGFMYACGPGPMLKGLAEYAGAGNLDKLYLSLEERMGCGTGACMGCAVKVRSGDGWVYKRVCKDGPVFKAEELIYET